MRQRFGWAGENYRRRFWIVVGALFAAHVVLVLSIVRQPLHVERRASGHSLIWPLHNDTVHRAGPAGDFFSLYAAGGAVAAGGDPYTAHRDPRLSPYANPYRYLPIVAQTLGQALSNRPAHAAYTLWVLITDLVLLILCVLLVRRSRPWLRYLAVSLLLLSSPYLLELHMGQFTFVSTALFAIALLLIRDVSTPATRAVAATSLTAAVLLKVFPLAAAPALLRSPTQRRLLATAAGALVVVSLPYFLTYPLRWQAFFSANFLGPIGGMDSGNHGLLYLVYILLEQVHAGWLAEHWSLFASVWRLIVLGLASLLVLLFRGRNPLLGASVMLLAHFLSYAHVWEHHYSGVLVLGLLIIYDLHTGETFSPVERWLALGSVVLLALPTPFALFDPQRNPAVWDLSSNWPIHVRMLMPLCKVLPTLALFAVAVRRLTLAGRTGTAGVTSS